MCQPLGMLHRTSADVPLSSVVSVNWQVIPSNISVRINSYTYILNLFCLCLFVLFKHSVKCL